MASECSSGREGEGAGRCWGWGERGFGVWGCDGILGDVDMVYVPRSELGGEGNGVVHGF